MLFGKLSKVERFFVCIFFKIYCFVVHTANRSQKSRLKKTDVVCGFTVLRPSNGPPTKTFDHCRYQIKKIPSSHCECLLFLRQLCRIYMENNIKNKRPNLLRTQTSTTIISIFRTNFRWNKIIGEKTVFGAVVKVLNWSIKPISRVLLSVVF